ncbi:acyl-CoA mutase large subunit family protein [Risungbinella massiliensis]|uniref:acyl-CoA mutase large subunit family protein n=1 Tax=Risungbinella massiliensis TaxID=1329796 RepID=UPI0005CC4BB0|nr:methylmalonyl-CoA mutase family protein [Risungbinella massiliensis]
MAEETTQKKVSTERKPSFTTHSGIPVDRIYEPKAKAPEATAGEYPYTRGIHPTMYRSRFWTMRQYAGFGSAEETNKRFRYLLDQGQTGLSVAFDLPTQIGYDSDDPMSLGEVGKVGVAIDSLADMEKLLAEIPLDRVSTSMTINAPASILLAMYLVVAEKQGVSWGQVSGTIQNDILKEYVARGTYIFPPAPSMRLITDIISFCAQKVPKWNTISISGYHIREAGSTAVQELAFTLANGIAYIRAAQKAGLEVDQFAPRLSFFFNAHNHLFEEVAKFRAARRMWAKIVREKFGAKKERSWQLRFHTQTGGSTLTAQQPDNNIVRVALQALAAILGGTQSLHTNSRDEALALPTEESARIALRTQQIIAYESGVADVVDPLGGSYYIEQLTDEVEEASWKYLDTIEEMGGAVQAVEEGYMQREIQRVAYETHRQMEAQEQIVVGMNQFVQEDEVSPPVLRVDPEVGRRQIAALKKMRSNRNSELVEKSLQNLRKLAATEANLMPAIIDTVRVYATVGEICHALRDVFGEHQPI